MIRIAFEESFHNLERCLPRSMMSFVRHLQPDVFVHYVRRFIRVEHRDDLIDLGSKTGKAHTQNSKTGGIASSSSS